MTVKECSNQKEFSLFSHCASKCDGTLKCWPCSLCSLAIDLAIVCMNFITAVIGQVVNHFFFFFYPLHVVIVWLFGLYSLQDGLVLVCHSQHITLPPGGVQAACMHAQNHKKHFPVIGMQPE